MDMMAPWPEQCQRFGLQHDMSEVGRVSKNEDGTFHITTTDGRDFDAISVIVATGSKPLLAGFPGEDEFFGRGVSTCATCDGFFYRGKEVSVIGGGDTALEEAIYLSDIVSKVYLVHRRDKFRAAPSTIERIQNKENIELVLNSTPKEVYGDQMGVQGLKVNTPEGERDLPTPGVFVFVGNKVINEPLKQEDGSFLCDVNEWGEVIVNLKMHTSVPGLYAAGDMRVDAAKQVVCAAGDGSTAALQAIHHVDQFKNA
jgi:thioredoxin reductase (NADPH)